jgi:hypothetical protein
MLPAPVTAVSGRRVGNTVLLQFTLPTRNTDGRGAVDLDHVEVYAHTGPLPTPADFLKYGTLVANLPVKSPASTAEPGGAELPGLAPGAVATVAERVTTAEMQLGNMPPSRIRVPVSNAVILDRETPGTVSAPAPVIRYYVAVATNRRNHRGAFSPPLAVPLIDPFPPPGSLAAQYAEDGVTLKWEPASRVDETFAPPAAYNLYEIDEPVAPAAAGAPVAGAPTVNSAPPKSAMNPTPLQTPTFKDARVEFGKRRCYEVRSVRIAGGVQVESTGSEPVCLTLTDTFPPAAPKSLGSVPNEGAINLFWDPNTETDLAGYLVLRAEAPDEKLTPLTPAPIHETSYRDTSVKPGVTYTYAIVAVDNAPEPNKSAQSNLVSEVAR